MIALKQPQAKWAKSTDSNLNENLIAIINQYGSNFSFGNGRGVSSTSRYIAMGSDAGRVLIWNLYSAKIVAILSDHVAQTTALEFHPHFPFLATADDNGCVHIYTSHQ